MIYHGNRIKLKDGISAETAHGALALLRRAGEEIPAVLDFVVGTDIGADYDFGAVFVLADLDGYWEYLSHPAHSAAERGGLPLMEKFEAFDITDDPDPEFGAKVAELQRRHVETDPVLAELMAALPENLGSSRVQ
ncbi:Dabb family protein [Cryptosporangium arvum]|uniref:Dabb family protein n=1 Tax=Cryptosporangium arvum TaxID=80871 RepID=UPI0004BA6F14|nr:Dabb family protein [Cryptosporangium arvum]